MMSRVADRIYEAIKQLTREKDEISNQIKKVERARDDEKKSLHRTEFQLLTEDSSEHQGGVPNTRLINELRDLSRKRINLRNDDKSLKELNARYSDLVKKIEHYQFWMRRADTTDQYRQREAEKQIFG